MTETQGYQIKVQNEITGEWATLPIVFPSDVEAFNAAKRIDVNKDRHRPRTNFEIVPAKSEPAS